MKHLIAKRDDRGDIGPGLIVTLAILAVLVVTIGGYFLSVAISGPKGHLDAIKIKNTAGNQIFSQEWFQDQYNTILAADKKVQIAYDAVQASPNDKTAKVDLTGTEQFCTDAIGSYNAAANKFSMQDFRSSGLPKQIDDSDPKTDCKPDNTSSSTSPSSSPSNS
jgi:hypothetical protein